MAAVDTPIPVVPDPIAIVRDFVNTTDRETHGDDIVTTAELTAYLFDRGLMDKRSRSTDDDLALARQFRAGLRRALELNHEGGSAGNEALDSALAVLPLELTWTGAKADLVPMSKGVRGGLSKIALAMHQATSEGIWWRLKICSSDECEWAYYDKSKNRSARWCEYGCGDRIKMRAYRARQKARATA